MSFSKYGSGVKFTKIPDEIESNYQQPNNIMAKAKDEVRAPLNNEEIASPLHRPSYQEISESLKKPGVTKILLLTVFSIVLSSFQFGYTVGVVNAPEKVVRQWYNETYIYRYKTNMDNRLNTLLWAITVASYGASGLIGGLMSGYLCEKFGRRGCLLLNDIPTFIAAALFTIARPSRSYEVVILARLFSGFSCGVSSGAVPIYLAEISPVSLRGATGATNQLAMTVSTLLALFLGLPPLLGSERRWPLLFALCALPAILQLGMLSFLPESPHYLLIARENEDKARHALKRLRGHNQEAAIDLEIDAMKLAHGEKISTPTLTYKEMIKNVVYKKGLYISSVSQIAQQMTGIGAIIAFSTSIFLSAGLVPRTAFYATCGMGAINVLVTTISMSLVEKLGRRTLFLSGLAGMGAANLLLTIFLVVGSPNNHGVTREWALFAAISMVIAFICCFAIGPGVIAWFVPAEIFTQVARSKGTTVSVAVNWIGNFLTILLFPLFNGLLGNYVFLIFAICALACWVYLFAYLPETKGKIPEQIMEELAESMSSKSKEQSKLLNNADVIQNNS